MFDKVNPRQSFPELEDNMTALWKKNRTFERSVEERDPTNKYVFYDGPPFITGIPHYGTLLSRIAKDVVPRYWTMQGKRVERQWGWDCHGLPIENKVENKLELKNRRDIEKLGIQKFVDECYKYTREVSAEWKWYVDKVGQWVDFDNSYKTMDQDYMESVMWVFKELYEKEHVYEGLRTSLYCTRCGTPVSNFEIAMDNSYADMQDPAIFIKFPVISAGEFQGKKIVAWTTTPWTLPSNRALVIDPEETYTIFSITKKSEKIHAEANEELIAAKPRLEHFLEKDGYKIIREFQGKDLLGLEYEPPFNYFAKDDNSHKVYAFPGMVHMNEGTGVVHSAPGFGEIDTEMGTENKISMAMSIDDQGKYIDKVADYKGIYVKDADAQIIKDLTAAGKILKADQIVHRYPYCWRCNTPLIHKAQPSWFVNIQNLKPDLVKNNELVNWVPGHLKEGRFKKGIEVAPDWGISRTRYWATPMPVWEKRENGEVKERIVIGSRDELREKSVQPITKVVFIRHAERDETGNLTAKGKQQASGLVSKYAETKFDAIYSSSVQRCVDTVAELASAQKLTVQTADILGSEKLHKSLEAKLNETKNKSEADLKAAFAEEIKQLETGFKKILADNNGKQILICTHKERLLFLRHIFEGRTLNEARGLKFAYAADTSMYFMDGQLLDLHRPKIDAVTLKGETGELTRVTEVLDVWMDSAAMPFASKHYPFEDKKDFEDNFPADFVVEYIAQTRAWFYVMHVVSTALLNRPPYKNVVTTGVLFGTDGRKMSKSYGNYPDPKMVLENYGAEALRFYLMSSRIMVGEDINLDEDALKEQVKTVLLPLWNSYSFFVTYANLKNWKPEARLLEPEFKESLTNQMDKWIMAKLEMLVRNFKTAMEDYDIPSAAREIPKFIDDLSRWYIRRSRNRFAEGDQNALATLYVVLVELSKVAAPILPFVSEAIYQNLVVNKVKEKPDSVHLCLFPIPDIKFLETNDKLLHQMENVREIVALGQSIRMQNSLKVRQPLSELQVQAELDPNRKIDFEEWMKELIMDEVNVRNVTEVTQISEKNGWINLSNETNSIKISINTEITEDLLKEGIFRELTRAIQNQRKKMGLQLADKVDITIIADAEVIKNALSEYEAKLKEIVGADSLTIKATGEGIETKISSEKIKLNINPK